MRSETLKNTNRTTFGIPDSNCDLFWSVCVCFTVPASTCPHRGGEEDSGSVCKQSATGDGSVSVLLLLRAHCTLVGMNAQSCHCHKTPDCIEFEFKKKKESKRSRQSIACMTASILNLNLLSVLSGFWELFCSRSLTAVKSGLFRSESQVNHGVDRVCRALGVPVTDHTYEDCRLMISAGELTLPMEAGLVEFTKISRKLR